MLKKILIALAAIIVIFLIVVAMQPADFTVERTATMAAPQAAMTWAGNDKVGEGKMTLIESRPNEAIKLKVDFVKPFEGTSTSEFAFKPEGDQTTVTWSMSGHRNFIAKAFCLGHEWREDDRRRPPEGLGPIEDRGRVGEGGEQQLAACV
jgi:hypothetical protein